jgi:hypothetical protein
MWQAMKRRLINIATVISGICAVAVILLYATTSSRGFTCFWSVPATRYDINIERGSVLVRQLHDYEFNTPYRWGFYEPESPKQFAAFKELTAWWHGDNSWWQRVGYTVTSRKRVAGFEYAVGEYWPPFVWQHPKVPFTVHQFPLLAIVLLFLLLPLCRACSKVVAVVRRKASHSASAIEASMQTAT